MNETGLYNISPPDWNWYALERIGQADAVLFIGGVPSPGCLACAGVGLIRQCHDIKFMKLSQGISLIALRFVN